MSVTSAQLQADLAFEQFKCAFLHFADELKFSPSQPRNPAGTREGGRWAAGSGPNSSSRSSPRPGGAGAALARRAAATALANPEAAAAIAAAGAMPAAATAVGVSRAAGLYDHHATGQAITPFLHIPYDDPLHVELQSVHASTRDDGAPYYALTPAAQAERDADCEDQHAEDLHNCRRYAEKYGGPGRPYSKREIGAVCRRQANERYSECLKGGVSRIRSPLFDGRE